MNLRKLYWIAGIVTVIVVSFYVAKHATLHLKAYAQLTATPFVAEIDYYAFSANPQGELFLKKVLARRSDGSTAEITTKEPINVSQRTVMFMNGATVSAFDLISAKTSFQMKPQELGQLKDRLTHAPADCILRNDVEIVGHEYLFRQPFIVQQHFGKVQRDRVTDWLAPALGCEPLGYRIENLQSDGTYKFVTEARLISLELKEPDPGFFDPATQFEELLPSEIARRHYEKFGQKELPKELDKWQKEADQYVKDHK